MSITDELRVFAKRWPCTDYIHKDMLAIADRIDTEHGRRMEERADRYAELRASLKERYVELPKDADGVPWNLGDRDEDCNVVIELRLTSSGWFVITDGELPYRPDPYRPERKRHHHAPTVEDMLTEFAAKLIERGELTNGGAQTIAEYAKRLTLAEGEDA